MPQRAIYRCSLCPDWTYPIWLVMALAATVFVAYVTFRHGLRAVLSADGGWILLSLFTCVVSLITLWQGRPRRKNPKEQIRLNLE